MPLIVEAYAGRVEMLNAIFGGGGGDKAKAQPSRRDPKRPALAMTGGDLAAGFRALAAMNRKGG